MQRYYARHEDMVRHDFSGEYVLFTDAQAKSLADERRIATLEAALTDALHRLEWFRDQKGMDSAAQIDWARAALRVETTRTQYPRVGEEEK